MLLVQCCLFDLAKAKKRKTKKKQQLAGSAATAAAGVRNVQPPLYTALLDRRDTSEAERIVAANPTSLTTVDGRGNGLLTMAIRMDRADAALWLIDHGAPSTIDSSNGATPLLLAVRTGQTEVVRAILDHGVDSAGAKIDQNVVCNDGYTILQHAAMTGQHAVIEGLLSRLPQPIIRTQDNRPVLVLYLLQKESLPTPAIVTALINAGADVTDEYYNPDTVGHGKTAFTLTAVEWTYHPVAKGNIDFLPFLLAPQNINHPSHRDTLLHALLKKSHLKLSFLQMLTELGFDAAQVVQHDAYGHCLTTLALGRSELHHLSYAAQESLSAGGKESWGYVAYGADTRASYMLDSFDNRELAAHAHHGAAGSERMRYVGSRLITCLTCL